MHGVPATLDSGQPSGFPSSCQMKLTCHHFTTLARFRILYVVHIFVLCFFVASQSLHFSLDLDMTDCILGEQNLGYQARF